MRLLQVSVRSLLLYSIILILISIPVVLFSIQTILNEEVDESISIQSEQFERHIKGFEYLDDLETDLTVLDKLSTNIRIKPADGKNIERNYQTVTLYDSLENEARPVRQLSSMIIIKDKPYVLTVQMSLVDNNDLVLAIGSVQVVLSILLTAGLLILNRSLSKKLWKPFYKTVDQLKAYELDKTESVQMEKSDIIEFNDLNKAVSHLTERNRKIFLQQKEFIENASHELQTPIAIFQSKLDTLMQNSSMSQADADTIMELESTAQRMSRLNKNLLLLSKIDNEQFAETEELELSSMVNSQVSLLAPMAQVDNTKLIANVAPLHISANKTLIEILISNLLHNAIRYGSKGEGVFITINDSTLTISNKGVPVRMKIEQMTQRFTKESSDVNSVGLGLAIVKRICDSYSYKLQYSYTGDTHSFSIVF